MPLNPNVLEDSIHACPECRDTKMCRLHQFMWDTKMAAIRAEANRPPTPWLVRMMWALGDCRPTVDDWITALMVLVLLKILFG